MSNLVKFLKASRAPGDSSIKFVGSNANRIDNRFPELSTSSVGQDSRDVRLIKRRQLKGSATRDYDSKHAVLTVRESPRLGTTAQPEFARFLESLEQQARFPTGKIVFATDNFLMSFVSEQDTERMVPVYNFGPAFVQTTGDHGRQPRLFNYGGMLLINDVEGSAFTEFRLAWEKYLRMSVQTESTNLVPLVCELTYRDQIRRGYLTRVDYTLQSQQPGMVQFNFTMFVVHTASIGSVPPATRSNVSTLSRRVEAEPASAIPAVPRIDRRSFFDVGEL